MEKDANSKTRVRGFSNREVAARGGMAGGKLSRRHRAIRIGTQLTSEEMLFMAEGIGIVVSSNIKALGLSIDEVEAQVKEVSHLLTAGQWHLVFAQTLKNPIESLSSWKKYLLKRWVEALEILEKDELTEDENELLRSLRNVSEAYNVATNTKTKWFKEAKNLT